MTKEHLRDAMKAYGGTVYRLALCRLQSIPDAEDVYQDVFLRFYGQDAADWEAERTKAWLIRTTVNRCVDLHRYRLQRPTVPLEELPDLTGAEAKELWAAVASLPGEQRTAVHLHYAEGYSCEEIAVMLHLPAATVRSRLHRARRKLKELLGGT